LLSSSPLPSARLLRTLLSRHILSYCPISTGAAATIRIKRMGKAETIVGPDKYLDV
jgi:hypothetical protein